MADQLEARWLQRPPRPLTDVALEVVSEVEAAQSGTAGRRADSYPENRSRPVRLRTLERMVQRQPRRIDVGERIAAQCGEAVLLKPV